MTQLKLSHWSPPKKEPNVWDVITHHIQHWDYVNEYGHWEGLSVSDRWNVRNVHEWNHCTWWSSEGPNYCIKQELVWK